MRSERPQGEGGPREPALSDWRRSMPVYAADTDRERRRRIIGEVVAWAVVLGMTGAFLWASVAAW